MTILYYFPDIYFLKSSIKT